MKLVVGDRVEDIAYHKGMTGTVVEVDYENPENPIVEHGLVTVRLDSQHIGRFPCSPVDEEHYVHYQWEKSLRRLNTVPYNERKAEALDRIAKCRPFFPPSCWWEPEGPCSRHDNEKGLEQVMDELEKRKM